MALVSVCILKGVGPQLEKRLARLGIQTLEDLLFHLPLRYQDRTRVTSIGELQIGEEAVVEADITQIEIIRQRRLTLLCRIQDDTSSLTLRFFHFNAGQQTQLKNGIRLRCYGEVRAGRETLEMIHPEYQLIENDGITEDETISKNQALTPTYPSTEGLHQRALRNLINQALQYLLNKPLPDYLPNDLSTSLKLLPLNEAIHLLHQPPPELLKNIINNSHAARQRLVFEELLAQQLSMRQLRQQWHQHTAPKLTREGTLIQRFF